MNIIWQTFNNTQVVNVVKIRISFCNGLFCILQKPVWYLSTNHFPTNYLTLATPRMSRVFFCYFITLQDTIQTVEMLPSDAEHIVELTPASTNEHIEAVAMMPTESEPVEPIDAQIVETVE